MGLLLFHDVLKNALGPDKLIIEDGHRFDTVRASNKMNGVESEGWPIAGMEPCMTGRRDSTECFS